MSQFHSVSHVGMAIFDRPIESLIGSVEIDLASAPIAPGAHEQSPHVAHAKCVSGLRPYGATRIATTRIANRPFSSTTV